MDKYKKFSQNTFWFALGSFGSKAISFFMIPLYTSVLTRVNYGKVDLVTTTINLLIPIITLQIVDATFRFGMDSRYNKKQVLSSSIIILLISTLFSLCLIPLFKYLSFTKDILNYFYLILVLNMFMQIIKQFIRSIDKVVIYAFSDILYTLSFVIFNIIFLVYKKYGISGYFMSFIISDIISMLFIIITCRIYKYIDFKNVNKTIIKEMLLFSIPLIPNVLSWWVMNVSDRYTLTFYLGLASSGIYAISCKIPTIISMANDIFYNSWQISAISEFNSNDKESFFTNMFNLNFTLLVLLTSFIIVILKPLFSIWVSKDFYEAWKYTPFLLMGAIFSSLSCFFGVGYIATKKTKGAFYTSIIGALVNLTIDLIFIPYWGIQVASFSTMAGYLSMWIIRIIQNKDDFKIKFNLKCIFLSFMILGMQITILYFNIKYQIIINFILLIILALINYKYINKLINKILELLKNKIKLLYESN